MFKVKQIVTLKWSLLPVPLNEVMSVVVDCKQSGSLRLSNKDIYYVLRLYCRSLYGEIRRRVSGIPGATWPEMFQVT